MIFFADTILMISGCLCAWIAAVYAFANPPALRGRVLLGGGGPRMNPAALKALEAMSTNRNNVIDSRTPIAELQLLSTDALAARYGRTASQRAAVTYALPERLAVAETAREHRTSITAKDLENGKTQLSLAIDDLLSEIESIVVDDDELQPTDTELVISNGPNPIGFDWKREILYFIHVNKAGGSTMKHVLIEWANYLGCKEAGNTDRLLKWSKQKQDTLCGVWAHRGYGIHKQVGWKTNKPVRYFSMLRDPIARLVSQYGYQYSNKHDTHQHGWQNSGPPFIDFARSVARGRHDEPYHSGDSPNCKQLCCWWLDGYGNNDDFPGACGFGTTRATLTCAKKRVDSIVMVGITEQLDETVKLLVHLTGMQDLRTNVRKVNVHHEAPYVPTVEERVELKQMLRFDYELYAYAKRKFAVDYANAFGR